MASRRDLEEWYSIDDLADENDALDARAQVQARAQQQMESQARRR